MSACADNNHGAIRFEVTDYGQGIPTSEQNKVFERFHRADPDRSAQKGGSGLGLSIARWIVELHGGEIAAQDNQPNGCRMVVSLPNPPPGANLPTANNQT